MSIMPQPCAPAVPACPGWCAHHDVVPDGDALLVIHRAPVAAGVALRQLDAHRPDCEPDRHAVEIVVDGDAVAVEEMRRRIDDQIVAVLLATSW